MTKDRSNESDHLGSSLTPAGEDAGHTPTEPLPWHVAIIGQNDIGANVCVLRGANGHAVAEYLAERDARLIAERINGHAELLEALRATEAYLAKRVTGTRGIGETDVLPKVRAAIAKATGSAQ